MRGPRGVGAAPPQLAQHTVHQREHGAVPQRHRLRWARRARRELHQCHVEVVSGRGAWLVASRAGRARRLDAAGSEEHRGPNRLEHPSLLPRRRARVERQVDRPGEPGAEQRGQRGRSVGQHRCDRLTGADAGRHERVAHDGRVTHQLGPGERLRTRPDHERLGIAVEQEVRERAHGWWGRGAPMGCHSCVAAVVPRTMRAISGSSSGSASSSITTSHRQWGS